MVFLFYHDPTAHSRNIRLTTRALRGHGRLISLNWLYFCAENSNNVQGARCVLVATRHKTRVSRGNMSTCLSHCLTELQTGS